MAHRRAVLGPLNGSLAPKVLFVGEAPGRRGADRTRRPFSGDASGDAFESLLAHAGLSRDEVFITNAVLCCPADDRRNHTPTTDEIRNCLPFLLRTIELLRPPVVATVGAVALRAIGDLFNRCLRLRDAVGSVIPLGAADTAVAHGPSLARASGSENPQLVTRCSPLATPAPSPLLFTLVPLYHPSPRVLHTVRGLDQQRADFLVLREAIPRGRPAHQQGQGRGTPAQKGGCDTRQPSP